MRRNKHKYLYVSQFLQIVNPQCRLECMGNDQGWDQLLLKVIEIRWVAVDDVIYVKHYSFILVASFCAWQSEQPSRKTTINLSICCILQILRYVNPWQKIKMYEHGSWLGTCPHDLDRDKMGDRGWCCLHGTYFIHHCSFCAKYSIQQFLETK